ncbi:hypothetical protein EJD97_008490 [Solanum chilense]|uniref:Retrotransposon gag domain-containing protein n=1 Tax=Solanum chilense TaxID=4083 RepID=A0A6N2BLR4_SOLCI|nr:hypothetical protein EJD97_008490 [Solanum chilense]
MDFTINTVASSEMIPSSSVAANSSSSIEIESPMEVIACLERQISELNLQQIQSSSLTHLTQDTPLGYTFSPPKAPTVTHHAPPVYIYVTTPHVTKAQEFHRNMLCTFTEDEHPHGYNISNFEKFTGSGNPFFHLKIYCENLIDVGNNEGIRIKLFIQCLRGKALEWYSKQYVTKSHTWDDLANAFVDYYNFNVEIDLDRISITKLKPKSI